MSNINFKYSKYPGEINISKIYVDRDIVEIKKTDLSNDVPPFMSFISPVEYKNDSFIFNSISNITPMYKLIDNNVSIYKYKDTSKQTFGKDTIVTTVATVVMNRTSDIPYLDYEITKKYVMYGEYNISNINNIIFNDKELSILNGEIISFRLFYDRNIESEVYIYPDYPNNLIRIYAFIDHDIQSATLEFSFTQFNNVEQYTNSYFLMNKVVDYTGDTYTIETTCLSINKDLLQTIYYTYTPTEFYSSRLVINTNTCMYSFYFKNNYFCVPKNVSYAQYNLYSKNKSVSILDANIQGAQIYIYPEFNSPRATSQSIKTDSINFLFTRKGESSLSFEIEYKVMQCYAVDLTSNELLFIEYDKEKRELIFDSSFTNRTYMIYVEYYLPETVGDKIGISVDKQIVYDISFSNSSILEKNDIQISFDMNQYNGYIGVENTSSNKVCSITASINESVMPVIVDMRDVNIGYLDNRLGGSPYELKLSPHKNTEYLIYTEEMEEHFNKIKFDINNNEKTLMDYILNRKPFYKDLMFLNLVELNKGVEYKLDVKIENDLYIIMITIETDTNLMYYIKNENPTISPAILKTTSLFGSSVIDQYDQTLFNDDILITRKKKISFAISPLLIPQNLPNFNNIKISVGLYDSTFNYYGSSNTKEYTIDLTGFSRGLLGEGLYGDTGK